MYIQCMHARLYWRAFHGCTQCISLMAPCQLRFGAGILLRGSHPGCIERRDRTRLVWLMERTCEFDGRLSVVFFNGSLFLYARANMASHGQRFVQVARSRPASSELKAAGSSSRTGHQAGGGAAGGLGLLDSEWGPFEPITIRGYAHTEGDVYFWGAQTNPVDDSSLIAAFPLVHHLHGCIGLSLSLDGVRWSRVSPLLSCEAIGERTLAHPAAPSMVRRGDRLWIYIHESVPGASVDAYLPKELHRIWSQTEAPGRIARYTFHVGILERWTRRARRSLLAHTGASERYEKGTAAE